MTKWPWLMIILALISTVQWPSSIAQHIRDDNFYEEGYLRSLRNYYNRMKRTSLANRNEITTTTTSLDLSDQKIDQLSSIQSTTIKMLPTSNLTIPVLNNEYLSNNKNINPRSSLKLPRTKTSSDIVFPNSNNDKHFRTSTNKLLPDPRIIEKCSKNGSFCARVDNYPRQDLLNIFRTSKFMSTDFFGIDAENDLENRINPNLQEFCESQEDVIFPEASVNKENKWLFIVQDTNHGDNKFVQGFKVEKCVNPGTPCTFNENLPIGYSSTCVQKYMYKKMVAVSDSKEIYYDDFKIPSCCKCMYSVNTDILTRKGFGDMESRKCSQNLPESTVKPKEVFHANDKRKNN